MKQIKLNIIDWAQTRSIHSYQLRFGDRLNHILKSSMSVSTLLLELYVSNCELGILFLQLFYHEIFVNLSWTIFCNCSATLWTFTVSRLVIKIFFRLVFRLLKHEIALSVIWSDFSGLNIPDAFGLIWRLGWFKRKVFCVDRLLALDSWILISGVGSVASWVWGTVWSVVEFALDEIIC